MADASLLRELRGDRADTPSVWFMRQAGRSLPEYRALREGTTMLDSCVRPEMAAEITLQPVRRHRVDAGIFFSDIVVPARQAGLGVEIRPGVGPVFEHPIRTEADVDALPPLDDEYSAALEPIREAVRLTVAELGTTPLIGFAGAPFTVASYMVEGGPSRDHLRTRALMRSRPEVWERLARWVAELSGRFLRAQVLAGASAVQLFDSWVGALGADMYTAHVQPHSAAALARVADLPVPRIHFGVGAAHLLPQMWDAGATVMGVDHRLRLDQALDVLPAGAPIQGNIDPAVLFTSEQARFAEARDVLAAGSRASGHVVNLGHGVPPDTDPQVLTDLVSFLHEQDAHGTDAHRA
ncbi:uroporphyrinogen decarboxylase [Brachybacterium sp. P6-10-X1]|uniref:uroporphyrinogen decarboxylase n=1 Tax=Brachybacterium sp. P6-10-X1 TaxID=1903186 RepID=UPI00097187CE|nr:uroporphyrinogen decarboxylase [Brachybacterium sp. P6-10-X1]